VFSRDTDGAARGGGEVVGLFVAVVDHRGGGGGRGGGGRRALPQSVQADVVAAQEGLVRLLQVVCEERSTRCMMGSDVSVSTRELQFS